MSVRQAVGRCFLLTACAGLTMCDAPACTGKSSARPPKAHATPGALASAPLNELLYVDQFGYLPALTKVAIAASPIRG